MTQAIGTTQVVNSGDNIGRGSGGATTGALSGAAQGASAGAAFGPWGAVIGGVIGGVAGFFGGSSADRAQQMLRKARAWEKQGKNREAAIAIRDAVRNFRATRAASVAAIGSEGGGLESSAPAGAVGAMGSQYAFSRAFTQGQFMIQQKVSKFLNKAGKANAASQNMFAMLDAGASIAGAFGKFYTPSASPSTPSSSSGTNQNAPTSETSSFVGPR